MTGSRSGGVGSGRPGAAGDLRAWSVAPPALVALVLLIGAALLIRTFASLREVNPGFTPDHVLSFETSLAGSKYSTTASVELLTRDLVRRIESCPV